MAIEIVSFPIKNGDFPYSDISLPKGTIDHQNMVWLTIALLTFIWHY